MQKKSEQVHGSVRFDADILDLPDSQAGLQASAAFQQAGVTDSDSRSAVGLEQDDSRRTSFTDAPRSCSGRRRTRAATCG